MIGGFEPAMIALIAGVFVIAGLVKGTTGIGLPTAAVGLMSQMFDPRVAIPLVVFPSLISNAWQIWRAGGVGDVFRRFWIYISCLTVFIALVSGLFTAVIPGPMLLTILGSVIVLFSVSSLVWAPPFLPERYDRAGQAVAGVASGVLGGFTAIWAPAMVTYLMARRVAKDDFVRATGVMIFSGTLPLIGGFWSAGLITGPSALVSLAMTAPALGGFALGEALRRRLDQERFRRIVLLVFLAMGLNLLRRALV